MKTLLPPRILTFINVFWLASLTGQAQSFGEAGSYGLKPSGGSGTETNTNFATGRIAPSIPLITLPGVAGGVTVGLQYQAGAGVKVNEVASEVGLGWALSGGGSITRDVKGFPDDSQYGWFINPANNVESYRQRFFTNNQNAAASYFPLQFSTAGDVVNYFKSSRGNIYTFPSSGVTQNYGAVTQATNMRTWLYPASQASNYGQYNPNAVYTNSPSNTLANNEARWIGNFAPDNEPDVYTVALPTGSIQFVFDPAGKPVPLLAQNIKIEALNLGARGFSAAGLLHEFRVVTSDGVQYYFGSPVGTANFKESISVTTRVLEMTGVGSKNDLSPYINKWHLRKIIYPSGEEISYAYSAGKTHELSTNNYLQQDWVFTALNGFRYNNCPQCSDRGHAWHTRNWQRRYTVRTSVSSVDTKQLASITSVQGSLQFTYQSVARKDVGGTTNALASIRLLNAQGTLIKRLDLVQHYADNGQTVPNAMPYDRYHLLLDRVVDKGTGCDYTNLWQFGYDQHTFCRNTATKDYWGYLNGVTYPADGTLVASFARPLVVTNRYELSGRNRSPDAGFTQYMILQSITAATGSVQSFAYELNDNSISASVSNTSVGGLRIQRISQYDGITHDNDIVDEYTYRKADNGSQSSGIWGDVGMYAKLQIIHDDVNEAQSSAPDSPVPSDASLRSMIPACNDIRNNNHSRADYYYLLRSDASMYEYATDYIDYSCVTVSHGAKGKTRYDFTSWADAAHQDYTDQDTRQVANNLNACPYDPLNQRVSDLPFSLEVDGLSLLASYNGNPVYTQGISADFPRRSSRAAERGLPSRITQLTNIDVPVATTVNEYDFSHSTVTLPTVSAVYVKPSFETFGFSQLFTHFQLYYYTIASQWCPLISSTEVVYNQQSGGDITKSLASKTIIHYADNPVNFFPDKITRFPIRYTSSTAFEVAGQYQVTEFRRAQSANFSDGTPTGTEDRTSTAGLLRSAGMMAPVIEQEQYTTQTLNGPKTNQLGASLTVYQAKNGHVVPYQTYALPLVSNFLPAAVAESRNGWVMSSDFRYQVTSTVTGYSTDMLPVNTVGRDGIAQGTIWGYGHTLPIASVVNGTAATGTSAADLRATSGHTSFEESGTGTDSDGWLLPPARSPDAKTGSFSARYVRSQNPYGLNKTLRFPSANRHGKYIFSCWAKVPVGAPTVSFQLVASRDGVTSQASPTFYVVPGEDWKHHEFAVDLDNAAWGSSGVEIDILHWLWLTGGETLLLDEMRIHPATAQMQTMTYQPLVGKTSSTGADGRTAYFTYHPDNSPYLALDHNRDVRSRTRSQVVNQARLTADFSPDYGKTQNPVNFVPEFSNCGDGTSYRWDFGDQSPLATGATPSHSYATQGTYQVTLIVTHPTKGVAKSTRPVTICGLFSTGIDVLAGNPDVDCRDNPNPDVVHLNAYTNNAQCYPAASYQWQLQTDVPYGVWTNITNATAADFSFQIRCGATEAYRCIITTSGGETNEGDPAIPVIISTGIANERSDYPSAVQAAQKDNQLK